MNNSLLRLLPLLLLLLAGCHKEAPQAPMSSTPPLPYFKATFNGVPNSVQVPAAGINNYMADVYSKSNGSFGYRTTDFDRDTAMVGCTAEISASESNFQTGIEIELVDFIYNQPQKPFPNPINYEAVIGQTQFEQLFKVGAYPYRDEIFSGYPSYKGVQITYRDVHAGQHRVWSTGRHPHTSGNTFQIVESTKSALLGSSPPDNLSQHNPLQLVKMKFDCTLYNLQGDSLVLKDGECLALFENFWFPHQ